MKKQNNWSGLTISNQMLKIVTVVLGISASYFLTIQSLKIDLAAKAEEEVVARLDKKLTNLEVILNPSPIVDG